MHKFVRAEELLAWRKRWVGRISWVIYQLYMSYEKVGYVLNFFPILNQNIY